VAVVGRGQRAAVPPGHGETACHDHGAPAPTSPAHPAPSVVTQRPGSPARQRYRPAALDRLPLVVPADTVPAADSGRDPHQLLTRPLLGRSYEGRRQSRRRKNEKGREPRSRLEVRASTMERKYK